MKIIGKTKNNFLLEANDYELGRLVGYYNVNDARRTGHINLDIGDEIQIDEMYKQLYGLSRQKERVEIVINTLQTTIQNLTLVPPVLKYIEQDSEQEIKATT